jgi:hypothetical protein
VNLPVTPVLDILIKLINFQLYHDGISSRSLILWPVSNIFMINTVLIFCFSHVTSYLIMWQIISPVVVITEILLKVALNTITLELIHVKKIYINNEINLDHVANYLPCRSLHVNRITPG